MNRDMENSRTIIDDVIHPIDAIRYRLYNNIFPFAYNNASGRLFSAIFKNKPALDESINMAFYSGNEQLLDDLWGTYLQIPENQRRFKRVLTPSRYKPSNSSNPNATYYSAPLNESERQYIVENGILHGKNKNAPKLLNPDFGNYTVSRGRDKKGDYVSYWDTWDLNPFRGVTKIDNKYIKKLGLDKVEDLSMGIGKPFDLYDRIYLDDYYGVTGKDKGGVYLPEVIVKPRSVQKQEEESENSIGEYAYGKLPGYKDGKIYIKPANRGKFNATKKRTGKTTEELTHSKNLITRKRAIFAQNAKKWKH